MNALAVTERGLYADKLPANTFAAWRIVGEQADPIEIDAATLADALDQAKVHCVHKQVLEILESGPRHAVLHTYRIKRSTTKGFYRPALDGGRQVWEGLLEADPITSRKVKAFVPVETFRWSPGCDVIGIDRTLVEQR